jgi:predicted transcriptional regulator
MDTTTIPTIEEIIKDTEKMIEDTTETPAKKAKRYRATQLEMENRVTDVITTVKTSKRPLGINEIATEVGIDYTRAASLIRYLIAEGKLSIVGREGRKILVGMPTMQEVKSLTHGHLDFALGDSLQVVGLHLQINAKPKIEVRSPNGKTIMVTIPNGEPRAA